MGWWWEGGGWGTPARCTPAEQPAALGSCTRPPRLVKWVYLSCTSWWWWWWWWWRGERCMLFCRRASFLKAGGGCGCTEDVEFMVLLDVRRAPGRHTQRGASLHRQEPSRSNQFSFSLNCQYFTILNRNQSYSFAFNTGFMQLINILSKRHQRICFPPS